MEGHTEEDDCAVNSEDEFANLKVRHRVLPILVCHRKTSTAVVDSPRDRLSKYSAGQKVGVKGFSCFGKGVGARGKSPGKEKSEENSTQGVQVAAALRL